MLLIEARMEQLAQQLDDLATNGTQRNIARAQFFSSPFLFHNHTQTPNWQDWRSSQESY